MAEIVMLPIVSQNEAHQRLVVALNRHLAAGGEPGPRDRDVRAGAYVLLGQVRVLEAQCAWLEAWLAAKGIDATAELVAVQSLVAEARALADLAARYPSARDLAGVT